MNGTTQGLGLLLHDAARALRKGFEARMEGHGLSSAQWRLLALACRDPGVSQAQLADRLDIEPISVSRLIDRMAAAGWIERCADPNDRRVRRVLPTEKALAAFQDIAKTADAVYAEALSGLSETQTQTLIQGLRTIVTNLSAPADPPLVDPLAAPQTPAARTTR